MKKSTFLALLSAFGLAYALTLAASLFTRVSAQAGAPLLPPLRTQTTHCDVYCTEGGLPYAGVIGGLADGYWAALSAAFDIDGRPTVVLCEDADALAAAAGLEHATAAGAYRAGAAYVLPAGDALAHELAHYAVDAKTGGNYPRWFTEGVALYYEQRLTGAEWRADLSGLAIDGAALRGRFDELDVGAAYRMAYEEVARYAQLRGEGGLQSVLAYLGRGADFYKIWR